MRVNALKLTIVLTAAAIIAGCGESEHTVSWYKEHAKVAQEKAAWCKDDTARLTKSDCQNAMSAVAENNMVGDALKTHKWNYVDITPDNGGQRARGGSSADGNHIDITPDKGGQLTKGNDAAGVNK